MTTVKFDTRPIDRVLADTGLPGIVAAVGTPGAVVYEAAVGVKDMASGAPIALDSVFRLASMTKAIVSAAALQLVEQQILNLDAPAATVLPELAHSQVLEGFDPDGGARLRPPRCPVTLRHLLSHSAGYTYESLDANLRRFLDTSGMPPMPESFEDLSRFPLVFDPGARWAYGINTDVVGKLIERASGRTLGEQLQSGLFEPLGMSDTTLSPRQDQQPRLAAVHQRLDDGRLAPFSFPDRGPLFLMGGGGLVGTGQDYLRFTRMLLNQGVLDHRRVLSPASVSAMFSNQLGLPSVTPLLSLDHSWSRDTEFLPSFDKKWSFAGMINMTDVPGGRRAGSLFWAGVTNTYFWVDPTSGITGVLLMQMLPFGDQSALAMFSAFERAVYKVFGQAAALGQLSAPPVVALD